MDGWEGGRKGLTWREGIGGGGVGWCRVGRIQNQANREAQYITSESHNHQISPAFQCISPPRAEPELTPFSLLVLR
jgi:hypothetical protein